ncbi:MAG: cysteine desulfurase [Caldilineaceae bacterium]
MTTAIPTDSATAGDTAIFAAGLVDEATLARLANEFYRLLPSASSLPAAPQGTPGDLQPQASEPPAPPPAAREIPAAVGPIGAPEPALQSGPAGGRPGGALLGVPEAYAAALPQVDLPAPASAGVPFYFLGEARAYTPPLAAAPPPYEDRITAQPFALPGSEKFGGVLGALAIGYPRDNTARTPSAAPDAGHNFYFLDPAGFTAGHVPDLQQGAQPPYDVHAVRRDFPVLHQKVYGKPLIWLDSAATSQKPQAVIDAESSFYEHDNSNIHRAAHALAARATDAYEGARKKVQNFLGASSPDEIIFVRGTTEGINLIAQTCGRQRLQPGDEIILTTLEHHANIVPWQFVAQEKGVVIKVVPITDTGEVRLEEYARLLSPRTRIVALTHVSNTLGTVVPVELMTALAHQVGATVVVDGAQSVPHFRVNVQALDCDFFVFSGHKLFAPTGIGAVYGKKALLEALPPWQGGGNMIDHVTFEHTTFNKVPYKFEAGTGHIGGAVGLGAAIDYLDRIGFEAATHYEDGLLAYATQGLATIPDLRLFGTAPHKVGVASFALGGISPEEIGKFLDRQGIAVRAGHHCAQPTMQRFGVTGMVRPSLAFYNTFEEIDALIAAVYKARKELA